jgi:mannose-6-phosphate isomerase-like protein (cupin superfamily)
MVPVTATKAVEKIKCNSAFIADIGTWHSLKNFSNKPAVALSIRLMPWSWEDFKTSSLPPMKGVTLG